MERQAVAPRERWFILASAFTVLLGVAVALYRLGAESLWLDESYTWWFTGMDWRGLLEATRLDAVNPPFYYVYVRLLAGGTSEAALRLPSVLAHAGGIAAAILLGRLLGGPLGGLAAGIVWSAHPLTLWAARDARPYALAAALSAAAVLAFFHVRRRPSARASVAAVTVLGLGLLTHYFFFVLAAALVVFALMDLRQSPAFFRRWTLLTLAAMVPLLAWLGYYFSQGSPSLGIGWIRTPTLVDLPLTMWNLASGYAGVFDTISTLVGLILASLIGLALLGRDRRLSASLLGAGILLPVASVWLISQRRPVYMDRYFIVLMPLAAGLVALGTAEAVRRWRHAAFLRAAPAALAAAALLAGLASAFSVQVEAKFAKEDWRGLVGFLQDQGATIESTSLSEPEITLPLSYYRFADVESGVPALIPTCGSSCWWVMRQPYTATHALTQSVKEPERSQRPVSQWCSAVESWQSPTGVAAWHQVCDDPGGG